MEHIFALKPELQQLSDTELLERFISRTDNVGIFHFYPAFASRLPLFKDILFNEAINEDRINQIAFGFIKESWIPVISVLDYCTDETIKTELGLLIKKAWPANEYENFLLYINRKENWRKYFLES